jgi:hypothetical protein
MNPTPPDPNFLCRQGEVVPESAAAESCTTHYQVPVPTQEDPVNNWFRAGRCLI